MVKLQSPASLLRFSTNGLQKQENICNKPSRQERLLMTIAGSPKKLAQDIASGFTMLSPPMLRSHTPSDLKTILF
ncbi:MAG TPA: hypothetical protein VJ910_09705, partial [Desulfuromonadales bacterium]|nr:hypothetical protein [Desulfuromonadales bacterium]